MVLRLQLLKLLRQCQLAQRLGSVPDRFSGPCPPAMKTCNLLLACALVSQAAALAPMQNLGLRGGAFSRKTFNLANCLQDHVDVLKSIPKIVDGYVGPNKIDPATAESCMAAVNSVNACPYCTSLHGNCIRPNRIPRCTLA